MKEQLTEYATALLAKQKGFDWECEHVYLISDSEIRHEKLQYYEGDGSGVVTNTGLKDSTFSFDGTRERLMCTAPTQSLLQKWLRDEHKIDLECATTFSRRYSFIGYKGASPSRSFSTDDFETYEQALEAGLQGALKLIEL